jgi:hypothetical protein
MWMNRPTGSWIIIDKELTQRLRQRIRATRLILAILFNPMEFVKLNLLPQGTSFTAVYLVANVTIPLASRHGRQQRDISRQKLHLHFDNSKYHAARHIYEQTARHRCVRVPHFHIHPIWLSQASISSGNYNNNSPGDLRTTNRTLYPSQKRNK